MFNNFIFKSCIFKTLIEDALQDLTILPMEFFYRRKTYISSVINLPTKS
jgi:hypothetical protein